MLTSYLEYQFEKMLDEMGPPGIGTVDASNAVPMTPAVTTTPTQNPGMQAQQGQQLQQVKGLLTQAWNLIKQTPNAKAAQPAFADLLSKIGFKVTGQGAQMTSQAQSANWQKQLAQPLKIAGLNPNVANMLTHFPKLTQAIQQYTKNPNEHQKYAHLLQSNQHLFPEWEKKLAAGQMRPQDILIKTTVPFGRVS